MSPLPYLFALISKALLYVLLLLDPDRFCHLEFPLLAVNQFNPLIKNRVDPILILHASLL